MSSSRKGRSNITAKLQDCFDHVDWDMFRIASNNIDVYAESVSEFISKCIVMLYPWRQLKPSPNQKPWINGSIRTELKARTTAFNQGKVTGNMTEYKQCSYSLRKAIKQAKRRSSTAQTQDVCGRVYSQSRITKRKPAPSRTRMSYSQTD